MNAKNETTVAAQNETVMKNKENLKWEKMLPDLGKDSPVYAVHRHVGIENAIQFEKR